MLNKIIFLKIDKFICTKARINKYRIKKKSKNNTNKSSPGPARLVGYILCEK
jgi:hypothetical protein